jgi:hypothetical protein
VQRAIALSTVDPRSGFSVVLREERVEKVKVEIECYIPWRLFPGKQQVRSTDLGAKHNELYLRELLPALERRGIAYTMR